MTTPDGQQLPETPGVEPAGGAMVRVCERCGTVCSTDQEWCLSCGVRMTEPTQRLPGLRAAGMVVALAVLLAGGAAAASYAALRGDTTPVASVAPETTPTPPVATTPPATTPPATPTTTPSVATPPPATTPPSTTDDDSGSAASDLQGLGIAGGSDTTGSSSSGSSSTGTSSGSGTSAGSGTSSSSGSTSTATGSSSATGSTSGAGSDADADAGSDSGSGTTTGKDEDASGPVVFASGQGSLYDPDGVVADRGDEGRAIDGNVKTSWQVTLNPGATGGFGYVLDFSRATALRSLKIVATTEGLVVKVLGTKKSTLPADQLNNGWDTLADETTLKTSAAGTTVQLQPASGEITKYKHVLVWVTKAPGTPAHARIKEFIASR